MKKNLLYSLAHIKESLKIKAERFRGVPFDYFMALSNLKKELTPLNIDNIDDIWLRYRINNSVMDTYRNNPYRFKGFNYVNGLENLLSNISKGGAIISLHYGHYRYILSKISEEMRKIIPSNKTIYVVADQESYTNDLKLIKWQRIFCNLNIKYLVAESDSVGLRLWRHMKQGGWFFLYLDGNRGYGDDSNPMEVNFLSSKIKIRSGIFRLMARSGKPIIPVIAFYSKELGPCLNIFRPIYVDADKLHDGLNSCLQVFRPYLMDQPELWRFWYRHHEHVIHWSNINESNTKNQEIKWWCRGSQPKMVMEVSSGNVFYVENRE